MSTRSAPASSITCAFGTVFLLAVFSMHTIAADPLQPEAPSEPPPAPTIRLLDTLPQMIDSMPTLLPPESDHVTTPPTEITKNSSWADRRHEQLSQWLDRTAQRMDQWFGEPADEALASASIRVMMDHHWNKYDEFELKPRVRGRIKLRSLERKLSLVFGDDTLDNELEDSVTLHNENRLNESSPEKTLDSRRVREDNASIALRWSNLSRKLPFETDADLGVRSLDDLYVRLKASKQWDWGNDYTFYAEQIYRYGIDSEHYLRTNLQLTHAAPKQAYLSNQFSMIYADAYDDNLIWDNRSFRQHQFFHAQYFNYGISLSGFINSDKAELNRYGPFMTWRQPIFREWLFVQSEVNYLNDRRLNRDHYLGALVRLEARF